MTHLKSIIYFFVFITFFIIKPACRADGTSSINMDVGQHSTDSNVAVKLTSREATRHIEGGLKLEKSLDLFGAIDSYTKAAVLVPTSPEVHFLLGEAYVKVERFDDALLSYTLAVKFAPDHLKALYGRSRLCLRVALYGQALKDLTKLIELSPNIADYHYQRARALLKLNSMKAAYQDFLRAHELDKRYPRPTLRGDDTPAIRKWAERTAGHLPEFVQSPQKSQNFTNSKAHDHWALLHA